MDRQKYLSNLDRYEGISLRGIAEKTGQHFNTVKKYVDRENWNEGYKPRKARESLLEPLKPIIEKWLTEDMKRSRKYRRTATKIFNDLKTDNEYNKFLAVGNNR